MSRFREIGATTFSALCCFHAAGQCIEPLFAARHISIPYQPTSVTAADVDNDGNADLIVACGLANRLLVLQGQGDGTVYESGSYTLGSGSTGQGPQVVIAVDINDDGLADLITANRSSADITVLKNLGFGVFDSPHTVAVGGSPWSVESGDVNNDGHVDLVVAQGTDTSGSVTVLVNTGRGQLWYAGDVLWRCWYNICNA